MIVSEKVLHKMEDCKYSLNIQTDDSTLCYVVDVGNPRTILSRLSDVNGYFNIDLVEYSLQEVDEETQVDEMYTRTIDGNSISCVDIKELK
jgi:hypothetical protein